MDFLLLEATTLNTVQRLGCVLEEKILLLYMAEFFPLATLSD